MAQSQAFGRFQVNLPHALTLVGCHPDVPHGCLEGVQHQVIHLALDLRQSGAGLRRAGEAAAEEKPAP